MTNQMWAQKGVFRLRAENKELGHAENEIKRRDVSGKEDAEGGIIFKK